MTSVVGPGAGLENPQREAKSIVSDLIRSDQVHGSLYTNPEIFAEELRKIWFTTWVFVGHESEVPQPFDYVRKKLATQDVVMRAARCTC